MRSDVPQQEVPITPDDELVPLAETRGYNPDDFIETRLETRWHNPLDRDYYLELPVGTQPMGKNHPPRNFEQLHGVKRVMIPAKGTKALPVEFDIAVQHLECQDFACTRQKHHCKNPEHRRVVVGGLGPHLLNLGLQKRPILSPALNEHEAARKAAVESSLQALRVEAAAKEALVITQAMVTETTRAADREKERAAKARAEVRAIPADKINKKDQ